MTFRSTAAAALAALCLGFGFGLGTPALAADYGVKTQDGETLAWTRIDKDNKSAWRLAVVAALQQRGFADLQIKKFSRIKFRLDLAKEDPANFAPKNGILTFRQNDLPVVWNTETGAPMPLDPLAYAKALPDCYAQDERSCTFTYSAQVPDNEDIKKPCLIPRRTQLFCRKVGFVNRKSESEGFSLTVTVQNYSPSCGEMQRGNGCGASEVTFDFDDASTKLAFALDEAEKEAAAPATPPAPEAEPAKIVLKLDGDYAYLSRSGPPQLEEWELDFEQISKLYKAQRALETGAFGEVGPKNKAKYDALSDQLGKLRNLDALKYCWPHDVMHPCDME